MFRLGGEANFGLCGRSAAGCRRATSITLTKLQRRTRPDQLTDQERAASYRRPWFVRAHRVVTKPFTAIRRAILERVDPRRGRGERGRVANDVET